MSLKILTHMLNHADRIAPWRWEDFISLNIPVSTYYRQLKILLQAKLVVKVSGGYVLSPLVLEAGTKQKDAFMRVDISKHQERIHGKA